MTTPTRFAVAKFPTPILNTPNFCEIFGGSDGVSLPIDPKGLLRAIDHSRLKQNLRFLPNAISRISCM